MIVAWVRYKKSKELLGLFWAPTMTDLWWSVDEHTDPFECEYSKTSKRGGNLVVRNKVNTQNLEFSAVDKLEDDGADDPYLFHMACGECAFYDLGEPKWKPFSPFNMELVRA